MTRRQLLLGLTGVAVLGLTVWLSAPGVRHLSFFKVRRIEVFGARYLTAEAITERMALPRDASLFDSVEEAERRVFAVRGVREVRIHRRWPATLVVTVREAEPVALTPTEDGLALLDARGWVLPFDPTRAPVDLPVAPADSLVARVVARVRAVAPALYGRLMSVGREADAIILRAQGQRYLLRRDATPEMIRALAAVVDDLARRGRRYRELDARFTDRIYVRGMTT